MKTFTKFALLSVGLASAALPFIRAANNTAAAPDPASVVKHPLLRAMVMRRAAVARHVAKRLGLSSDQIARLKSLRMQTASTVRGIRTDPSLTIGQKKARARETLQGARAAMRAVLTTDQQAKLDQMRENLRAFRNGNL
jgi:hypothetical protein